MQVATRLRRSINASKGDFQLISIKEINDATMKFSNWKSPGIDNIQNFWWNKFTNLHQRLVELYNEITQHPEISPPWFTTGRTTLIPKKKPTDAPSNYRPITCLPTSFKILLSIITSTSTTSSQKNKRDASRENKERSTS